MAAPKTSPVQFENLSPPWSLVTLDANFTALDSAISKANNYSNYLVDSGAANVYVVTFPGTMTVTLTAGLMVQMRAANSNTGASTLNVNGLGAVAIVNTDGTALTSNNITANGTFTLIYDGTNFQLQNKISAGAVNLLPLNNTWTGTNTYSAGVTLNSTLTSNGTNSFTGANTWSNASSLTIHGAISSDANNAWTGVNTFSLDVYFTNAIHSSGTNTWSGSNTWSNTCLFNDGLSIGDYSWVTSLHAGWSSLSINTVNIISSGTRSVPGPGESAGLYVVRTSDQSPGAMYWSLGSIANNDNTSSTTAYGAYIEAYKQATAHANGITQGMEIDLVNRYAGGAPATDPYNPNAAGLIEGIRVGVGKLGTPTSYNASHAYAVLSILGSGNAFNSGLLIGSGSCVAGQAIALPVSYKMQWYSAAATPTSLIRSDATVGATAACLVLADNSFNLQYNSTNIFTVDNTGKISTNNTTTYGSAGALTGYIPMTINGTTYKIPYYAV